MASSSLVLPSPSLKTLVFFKGRNPSLSLFGSTLSLPSVLKSQNKPLSLSFSFPPHRRYEAISSPFVRNVAISSEFEQEVEAFSEGDEPSFSPVLKINVGNVPLNIDAAELAKLFELAGNVEMVEVIYHELMGIPEGFVFVTMSTVEEVEAAIQKFNGYELEGRRLRVKCTCLPQEKFREARVVYDKRSGKSRGFKFVAYSSAEELSNTIESLNGVKCDMSQKGNENADSSRVAWKVIIDKFKEKTGIEYFMKQLRNQLDNMKRLYDAWVVLCGQTGIGWNDITHTITVDPERWEAYLETQKEFYNAWVALCGQAGWNNATHTITMDPERWKAYLETHKEMTLLFEGISATRAVKWAPHAIKDNVDAVEFLAKVEPKQRELNKIILDASIASLASSIKEGTSIGPSMAECVESLQRMQDVVEPSLFLCALRSFRDLKNRRIWMMLKKEELRLEWLKDRMNLGQ